MIHQSKVEVVEKAIEDLFSDTTVPPEETLEDLQGLQADIEIKIGCLAEDIKREAERA